jgi:hypothetical protein
MALDELISRTLLLDIETTKSGKIRQIGAVFNDQVFETNAESSLKLTLSHVEDLASVADFVLGHNLLGHDFPVLQSTYPQLAILKKPVIDTLYLSPLAFPQNPYHRLVKDYKLVRSSVSDPVADVVEETLRAALADPAAANAVRSGRLTTSLRYAGFGELDVSDVVALPTARPAAVPNGARRALSGTVADTSEEEALPALSAERAAHEAALREAARAVKAAEDAARQSQGAALVAEQHRDDLRRRAGVARDRLDKAHARVAEIESQLASARTAASTAAAAWAPVHAEADSAAIRADTARGLADRARAMLESARHHLADVEAATAEPTD